MRIQWIPASAGMTLVTVVAPKKYPQSFEYCNPAVKIVKKYGGFERFKKLHFRAKIQI